MTAISIFYGSTDGNTARVAGEMAARIRELLAPAPVEIALVDIGRFHIDDPAGSDLLLFGVPTWNQGQLQADWEEAIDDLDQIDLRGVPVAVFGLGDQTGYPATFVDALFFVADRLRTAGAVLLGRWPVAGYQYTGSWAVEEDMFLGLVLDEINQPELTPKRVARWLDSVLADADLLPDSSQVDSD